MRVLESIYRRRYEGNGNGAEELGSEISGGGKGVEIA